MARISSSTGLVSGINSKDIIDQLISIEARSKNLVQTRIDSANSQIVAYADLRTRLTSLKLTGTTLKKNSTFEAATATSNNEDVLTATASKGAAVGTYQFQVARLVTSQQSVSTGFVDFNKAKVGAGTITLSLGGGEITNENKLSDLNGGAGVRRGIFRITDKTGKTTTIDITAAVSLDDVVKKINTNLDVNLKASVKDDKLTLTDLTGGTGSLTVQDVGDGHAAADLGIAGTTTTTALVGSDVNFLTAKTALSQLNDSRGVTTAASGADLQIQTLDGGAPITVALGSSKTLGDVIDQINTAGAGKVTARLGASGNGIELTDTTGGGGTFSVISINGSTAAEDLGIARSGSASTLTGGNILGSLGTVSLSTLNGGAGLSLGTLTVKNRNSSSTVDIDLSAARSVSDVLDTINSSGAGIKAAVSASGSSFTFTDTTGGTGTLDFSGVAADSLGVTGSFANSKTEVTGANLHRQYVSKSTLIANYNGGKGVSNGSFKITNAAGRSATIAIDSANTTRLADVISRINAQGIGVTASINTHGNGLLLTDSSGGVGTLKVEDVSGTAAADLRIKGSAVANQIDGAQEKTITVTATDTLTDVQKKINDASFGVTAQIISDGSAQSPYRLTLNTLNSGLAGRVVIDNGTTGLGTQTLVHAQDAAVFVGGTDAAQPLLITASKNQLAGVIKGVTIDLHSVSDKPVQLTIARTADNVVTELNTFVENFNGFVDKIGELTKFDTDTNTRGLLLGETAIQTVQTEIYAAIGTVVKGGGSYRTLGDIGLTVGDGAKLVFDQDKFNKAYAENPDAVEKLFAATPPGLTTETKLSALNAGSGLRINPSGNDLKVTLKDGTAFEVSLHDAATLGEAIAAINAASGGKLTADIPLNSRGIRLLDTSGGTGSFKVESLGSSQAATDLGISTSVTATTINGSALVSADDFTKTGGGIGFALESRITKLIDPVAGVITRQNKTLEDKTTGFQDRIESLDKLLTAKRTRLETQFANMESVLAKIQSQQTSLANIHSLPTAA